MLTKHKINIKMIRIKKGFVASAAIVVAGFVVVAGILLFDSSSGKAKTDKAPQWVEQAGEGLMAPACASSLPETITCVGGVPQVILKAPNDSTKTCNFDVHISKIVGGVAIQVKPMDNIPDVLGVPSGGMISYTFNAEKNTYYTWDFFDQGNPGAGKHCVGTGPYDKRMSAGVFSTPSCVVPITGVSCSVSPNSIVQGGQATWTATASGGTAPLTYSWTSNNPEGPSGTGNPKIITYNQAGSKTGSVTVSDSAGQSVGPIDCLSDVTVTPPGGKAVDLTVDPPLSRVQNSGDFTVNWNFISGFSLFDSLNDWIGMYTLGAADDAYIESQQTFGGSSGDRPFSSNHTPGTYEFRYFDTPSGYVGNRLGTSLPVTIMALTQCNDGIDNDGDLAYPGGGIDAADPSCAQSGGTTEYSACNDKNPDGTLRDNDGDGVANIFDPGCHSDGNPNNPATYDPNDNDESNTVFKEVFAPFEQLLGMLFRIF